DLQDNITSTMPKPTYNEKITFTRDKTTQTSPVAILKESDCFHALQNICSIFNAHSSSTSFENLRDKILISVESLFHPVENNEDSQFEENITARVYNEIENEKEKERLKKEMSDKL